jgi:hypothetical protein
MDPTRLQKQVGFVLCHGIVITSQATCPIKFEQIKEVFVSVSQRMLVHDMEMAVFVPNVTQGGHSSLSAGTVKSADSYTRAGDKRRFGCVLTAYHCGAVVCFQLVCYLNSLIPYHQNRNPAV